MKEHREEQKSWSKDNRGSPSESNQLLLRYQIPLLQGVLITTVKQAQALYKAGVFHASIEHLSVIVAC